MNDEALGELAGRTVLIAGAGDAATGAIAAAAASCLSAAGAGLVFAGDPAPNRDLALRHDGGDHGGALFHAADLGSETDWEALIEAAIARFGRLDAVINLAPAPASGTIAETTLETFRAGNTATLHRAFLGTRFGAIAIRRHGEGGSIVNVASVAGRASGAGAAALSAAHGGIRLMTKAAALDLGPEKIRVNALLVGSGDGLAGKASRAIPLGRGAAPGDAAGALLFLASPRGRYMTGADLAVDGGLLAGI